MLGYLYGKRFGSKIASANRKEGDRVGARPSVPKRWHIKFRRQGITQKKAFNKQGSVSQ